MYAFFMKKHRKSFKGMSQFYQGNEQKTMKVFRPRLWIGIVTLSVAFLLVGAIFTYAPHPTFAQQSKVTLASNIAQQQLQLQAQMSSDHQTTTVSQHTAQSLTDTAQTCNDPGATNDTNTAPGNIDGAGNSYSINALQKTPIQSSFVEDGLQFDWYNTLYTDCISNGQVLPITNGTTNDIALGLIGSATNGAVAGTAIITYDDGTKQPFQLGFSDWTLGGGRQAPSYGNKVVSAQLYRNTRQGQQNVKTFLFFTKVALQANKKAISITMPLLTGRAQLHVFAWSTTTSHSADLYNNVGSTDDAYTQAGNFDGAGNSYPSDRLYWAPGEPMGAVPLSPFIAPDVVGGAPDNYEAAGQTIPLNAQGTSFGSISFAGAASNGPSYGTASVNYTDGTRQTFTLSLSDWTLNGGRQAPSFSNQPVATFKYRNTPKGQQSMPVFIFSTSVNIQASKIVQSVTLPSSTNQGKLHIFSIALLDGSGMNIIGSTNDASPLFGNLDGSNHSYSEDALKKAGIPMSSQTSVVSAFSFHGSIMTWTTSNSLYANSWIAEGQPLAYQSAITANATDITFIGAATNGNSSGTGTVYYTDGTSSTYTLSFTDWCASTPQFGNLPLVTLPYRNTAFGQQAIKNSVYYAEAAIDPTKTLQSITLPHTTGGQMHIFGYGYRVGPYNNIGGSLNEELQNIVNFDGQHNGYSYDALSAAGLAKGPVVVNGVTFNWDNASYGAADNYQASGQVVLVTPVAQAKTLAFLGAATNGSASGTATIMYTDGTKQTFTLGLTDWCSSTVAFNNRIAAAATYRLTPHGHQTIKTSVYYTDVALQNGKTVKSVILPTNGQIHIFAIATK
jgi:hypothetical protein